MAFGKPGRPPEDRLARQDEIYQAVAPLLLEVGPRRLSMHDAAYAACLSIGGLYHYFPTKESLILHGLAAESSGRQCEEIRASLRNLPLLAERLDFLLESAVRVCSFIHPSARAALAMGPSAVRFVLEQFLDGQTREVANILPLLVPMPRAETVSVAKVMTCVGVKEILCDAPDFAELREQLRLILDGYLSRLRSASAGMDVPRPQKATPVRHSAVVIGKSSVGGSGGPTISI